MHSLKRRAVDATIALGLFLIAMGCSTTTYPSGPMHPADITSLGANVYQVTVDARAPWVATGINVKAGQKVSFSANGTWGESPGVNRSADGGQAGMFGSGYWGVVPRLPGAPWGALVGRVGPNVFFIGVADTLAMPQDGELMLGINDGDNYLSDNHGYQTVKITVQN